MDTDLGLKRGSFVKDRRTGAVVKVSEIGGRDVLVRPAYKSDGYWVGPEHLDRAKDPHELTGRRFAALMFAVGAVCALSSGITRDLLSHDFKMWEALAYTAPAAWVQLMIISVWAKIVRV